MKQLKDMDEQELAVLMVTEFDGIEAIAARLGVEKPLFVLLMFNDPAIAQYIGNCERKSIIAALRETADRLERKNRMS